MNKTEKIYEVLNGGDVELALKMLKDNIYEETCKKGRKTSELTIMKRLLKLNEKTNPRLTKYMPYEEWKCLVAGYYILMTKKDVPCEIAEEHDRLKIEPIAQNLEDCDVEFNVDVLDVKAFYKLHKKDKQPYILELHGIKGNPQAHYLAVNPQYLIDCLEFSGSSVVRIHSCDFKNKEYKGMIVFEGLLENKAGLCPVNLGKVDSEHPPKTQRSIWF